MIILIVFGGWQLMAVVLQDDTSVVKEVQKTSRIKLIRASWGLNCSEEHLRSNKSTVEAVGDYAYKENDTIKLYENNILDVIKRECEGRMSCRIANNVDTVGFDPVPSCLNKFMTIEYRCYSFDRLWTLTIPPRSSGSIDCSNVTPPGR